MAHLGALQALAEMGIEPTVVSGTSAGSIVGAMYAAGHPVEKIRQFFIDTPIFKASHFATMKPGIINSDKYVPFFQPYFPEDDFAALKKKCYVTTTDILHGKCKTFSEGPIIRPILASCAVPVVFSPVEIDGILYTDGGTLNNFPVEPLLNRCDVIIGVDVHPIKVVTPKEIRSTFAVMERISHLAVYYHSVQKHHLCDVTIAPPELARFGIFDRTSFDEIFEIGYQATVNRKEDLLAAMA